MADLQKDVATTSSMVEKPQNLEPKAKFVFNKCCFCIPLRIGCLILAYLYLVYTIVVGTYSSKGMVTLVMIMLHLPEMHGMLLLMVLIHALFLALVLVSLAFNIVLLIGLHQGRRKFVKMFVIFQLVNVILNVIQQIVMFSFMHMQAVGIIINLAIDVLNIYYLLVIRSQYVKMGEAIDKLPGQVYRDGRVKIMP